MSIIKGTEVVEKGIFDEYVKGAKEALEVTTQLEKIAKGALKSDSAKIDLIKPDSLKSIQQFNKLLQDSNKQIIALEQIEKKKLETSIALERLEKQRLTTQQQDIRNKGQLEKLEQDSIRTKTAKLNLEVKEQKEKERKIKTEQREANQLKQLNREYSIQSKLLNDLRKKYKDVALTQGENSKEARNLLRQITPLDKALKRVDNTVGQNQRTVGKYTTAFKNLTSQLGIFVGVAGAFKVVKDSIGVIRGFESSILSLAGVFRESREELIDVETEIRRVGSTSVRSATETADLAESLATLGKSKEEIIALLEPVTNLSIGLQASSEDAGEFLIQMLNSFGAGAEEASKYADTIASIRTSTSLDFQKMRDSFQYIAPISRILNKDLAYTGSLVGILADNGIKAERAGRLLGTAQQKLASENKTLSDALQEINQAQAEGRKETELLALASELFGKQSASLGIVLANNNELIDANAQKIRDNGGALDDLVNTQLESLDSMLKILSSAWQDYILEVNSSTGATNGLKSVIGFLTRNLATIINTVAGVVGAFLSYKVVILALNTAQKIATGLTIAYRVAVVALNGGLSKAVKGIKAFKVALAGSGIGLAVVALGALVSALYDSTEATDEDTLAVEANKKAQEDLNKELEKRIDNLETLNKELNEGADLQSFSTGQLKELRAEYKRNIDATNGLVSAYGVSDSALKQSGKSLEDYFLSLLKGTDISNEAIQNLYKRRDALLFLDKVQKEITKRGAGDSASTKSSDKSKEKELTYLATLKKELKEINQERESLLTKDSDQYANEFKKATEEAKKLKQEIQELEDILNGKTSSTSVNDSDDNSPFARQKAKIVEIDVAETEAQDKRVEREKQRIANAKKTYQNLNSVADAFAQRSQQRSEARQEEIDREIAVSQSRADAIRKIAEEGNISAQQSLAVEQQRQAEATLQKEKEIQKQKQIEAGLAMLKTYTAELEQGKKPLEALGSSALIGTAIASMISALPSFEVGTESLGKVGAGVDGKGGRLIIAHDEERIVPKNINSSLNGISNAELPQMADVFLAHKQGLLTPKVTLNSWQSSSQVLTKFEELNNSVKNLTKVTQTTERYDFDNLTNTLVKTVKSGNSVKNTHSKKSVLW